MKNLKTKKLDPKRGTGAWYKMQRAFENREISVWQAIADGVFFILTFALFIIAYAVI